MMQKSLQVAVVSSAVLLLYLIWKYIIPEVFVIFKVGFTALLPFIAAAALAVLIEPLVIFLQRRVGFNRAASVALTMVGVLGLILLILIYLVFRLAMELKDLSMYIPKYFGPVEQSIRDAIERGKIFYFQLPESVTERLQEGMNTTAGELSQIAGNVANNLLHLAASLPGVVVVIIVTLIATYFISRDKQEIVKFWLKIAPKPWGGRFVEIGRDASGAFLAYIRAQLILITFTAIQSIVGLELIGAQYALTIGLLVGILDLIPVLGPAAVFIPWLAWSFFTGAVVFGIKLTVLYVIIWLVRQLLEAKVVASTLGIHPLAALLAMYIGLKTIGPAGLILGPVTLVLVQTFVKTSAEHKN